MKKKWIPIVLICSIFFCFSACGTQTTEENSHTKTKQNEVELEHKITEAPSDNEKLEESVTSEPDISEIIEETESELTLENEYITSMEVEIINPYFTQGNQTIWYDARFCFNEDLPDKETISFHFVKELGEGQLFELVIDCEEEIMSKYPDIFHLGYFYVTKDTILCFRGYIEEKFFIDAYDMKVEDISEEIIRLYGTEVFSTIPKEDDLGAEEPGWHEIITVKENRISYSCYNNMVETGFYENFDWEKGKGLVQYVSGYGAEQNGIDLLLREN